MATEQRIVGRARGQEEGEQFYDLDGADDHRGVVPRREAAAGNKRVSRLSVEGALQQAAGDEPRRRQGVYEIGGGRPSGNSSNKPLLLQQEEDEVTGRRTLPPPHAWLAIEGTAARTTTKPQQSYDSDPEAADPWARLLRPQRQQQQPQPQPQRRRSSFCVVRRERAAREAWLDRAWEMKRSWHERNGGAPDAGTPVVVVVGGGGGGKQQQGGGGGGEDGSGSGSGPGAVGGGGVAMDVEEVRACRDLGLELPSDCSVEIQCYGLSGGSSPTHTASSGGADSPCALNSPGADPTDVKARLKVWAQAVALASTTHLGS